MSDTAIARAPLDIGGVLSGTFSVLFSRIWYFAGVTFIAVFVIAIVFAAATALFVGVNANLADGLSGAMVIVSLLLGAVLGLLGLGLMLLLTRSAVSVRLGQGVEFNKALTAAVVGAPIFLVLGVVIYIAVVIGFALLIVPGLYITAMVSALMPAIAYERAGFRAVARSFSLTSGYRWSIVGLTLIWAAINVAISIVFQIIFGVLSFAIMAPLSLDSGAGAAGAAPVILTFVLMLLSLLAYCVILPLGAIFPGVLYARLVEIKEGGGAENLKTVFE